MCEWITVSPELYICQASQALHKCTIKECEYRSDAGPLGHQKGLGSHSVCMLTGIIREPVEFGRPDYGTHDGEQCEMKPIQPAKPASTLASRLRQNYGKNHMEAKQIVLDLLSDATDEIPKQLPADLATVCVRLWHIVHNKANRMLDKTQICRFGELCLVILYDMSMFGLRHFLRAGDANTMIEVLPAHPFLREWMPKASEVSNYMSTSTGKPFEWNINNSKCLHTAIASLEREQQKLLADEVRNLASFRRL